MMLRLPRTALLLPIAFALSCARTGVESPAAAPASSGRTQADITADDLRQRLFLIAHDSMMGRETGSEGNYKAQEYIAAEFRRLGLEPGGENGTYFQTVPFWRVGIDPASQLSAGGQPLALYRDFIPSSSVAPQMTLQNAPVIYAGSLADTARLIAPDDGSGMVVVVDVPAGVRPQLVGLINARYRTAMTTARIQLERLAPEQVARLSAGRPVADTSRNNAVLPGLVISRAAAATIFGTDVSALVPGAKGKPITGRFDFARTPTARPARNVIAILRGRDPAIRGQYLALTAHNDHVGFDRSPVDHDSLRAFNRHVRPMGADSPQRDATPAEWSRIRPLLDSLRRANPPRMDSIRNGADDDGSGTVSLLEIAEKLASGQRPRRSVLFVSHTGEEDGLVGSRWFTDHATVPVDSIVAEIDQDMIGRALPSDLPGGFERAPGSPTYLEVIGAKRLSREFGDTLEAANARQKVPFKFDYTYDTPGHPLQYYCRADHYSYARYGIPAVAISRGEHLDYHQITDEPQYINYPDLARVSQLVYSAAVAIANQPTRPKLDGPKPTLGARCIQ
jgi:hypothetical protein